MKTKQVVESIWKMKALKLLCDVSCNDFVTSQVPLQTGTRVMITTGIKAMEITAIMVTVIKDTGDMVAMITLVTTIIMDTQITAVCISQAP